MCAQMGGRVGVWKEEEIIYSCPLRFLKNTHSLSLLLPLFPLLPLIVLLLLSLLSLSLSAT